MHDDEFSDIIGSGTEHRVSVSERTGNAKTPQNNVSSHESELLERKRSFEAREQETLDAQKALAAVIAEHAGPSVSQDPKDENIQHISNDATSNNRQSLPEKNAARPNSQSVETDSVDDNRQRVDGDKTTNRQSVSTEGVKKNQAQIPTENAPSNRQTLAMDGASDNRQPLPKEATLTPNQQPVATPAAALNRQAIDNPTRQAHLIPLPNQAVERAKVDFPPSAPSAGVPHAPQGARPAAPKTLSAQNLQGLQLNHEKFNDEFHGRLAGIKHNVDALNERLSDFEEKTQKDDAQLIKGNPDDFKVDLE